MSTVSQIIWIWKSIWHKAQKCNIHLGIGEEVLKYYFNQIKVAFDQWKKEILFVSEFGFHTYEACGNSDVQISRKKYNLTSSISMKDRTVEYSL